MSHSDHGSKPAGSQFAGPPSADLASSADFEASLVTPNTSGDSAGDAGSVDGGGVRRARAEGRKPLRGGSGAEPPMGAAKAAPSSLDTFVITRRTEERTASRKGWLRQVGDATSKHRSEKARVLKSKGRAKYRVARDQGFSELYAKESAEWYEARAKAQIERIARVETCGAESIETRCLCCDRTHVHVLGCRIGLLCLSCRGKIASQKRGRFLTARASVLEEALARGLLNPRRRGGRWSEKLLTLTSPHVEGDSISSRIDRVAIAWPHFLRKLNDHWRTIDARSSQFFRCLEWTPGNDGFGHPHIHLWLFCPYLDRETIREWWGDALRGAGLDSDAPVVVDVREVSNPAGAASEIIKYLTKDIDASGEKVPAEVYAHVYEAFDSRRVTQASRGFMGRAKRTETCECGSTIPKRVRTVKPEESKTEQYEKETS